jgi:hypothetical protein
MTFVVQDGCLDLLDGAISHDEVGVVEGSLERLIVLSKHRYLRNRSIQSMLIQSP